ncbi:MAG: purine-nucleoside phosphorylase [Oscillospiraceae bacterium]|jgi:purine-nucleoside phosphorylase|nr:purine-nucleoside phosphorylase [Oscillospiraceae bacterium]
MTRYTASADYIRSRTGNFTPDIALVLGSGLGFLGDRCENAAVIPYEEIPNFPRSTAPGHAGRLVLGVLGGKKVAVMQGRFHYYEGYGYTESVYGIRTLRLLGAKTLLVTNASGGVSYAPGDIMLITDHIKFFDESPLRGENLPEFGSRFTDMSFAYTPALRAKAREAARSMGIPLPEGVYMYFPGPQYETPAEIRAAKILGADAVGMSTVPEVIAASHAGMEVLGFSLVCNKAAGLQSHGLSEEEVLDTAEKSKDVFSKLILRCLEEL